MVNLLCLDKKKEIGFFVLCSTFRNFATDYGHITYF